MLPRLMILSTMLGLLMACIPAQTVPTTPTIQLVIPTPPTTADADTALLPILLPNEANTWITYHDGLADFGLAIPQQWRIAPPDPHATQPTLTLANFNTMLIDSQCDWPNGLAQLAFTAWEVDPEQPTLDWIGNELVAVQSLEAVMNGRYAGYLLTTDQQQLVLRLTPDLLLKVQVIPQTAWQLPDVQNILISLATPHETVDIPASQPTAPVALPGFCQDAVHLYSGAGTHFAEVGLLFADDSLAVLGFSHDGRWLKLLYPNAPERTAWASVTEAITTAGEPPIEPIQVRPGNS